MGFQKEKQSLKNHHQMIADLQISCIKCIRYLISVVFPFLKITLPV